MVTTSLQVTPDQLAWLRRQAAAQGISIAEVLRRMIAREIQMRRDMELVRIECANRSPPTRRAIVLW